MTMRIGGLQSGLKRGIADFTLALALFWAVVLLAGVESDDRAYAVPLPELTAAEALLELGGSNPASFHVPGTTSLYLPSEAPAQRNKELGLLSVAVATIAAFNLAFWRHLRRAYASPRRSVWRRVG